MNKITTKKEYMKKKTRVPIYSQQIKLASLKMNKDKNFMIGQLSVFTDVILMKNKNCEKYEGWSLYLVPAMFEDKKEGDGKIDI